jgi:hypothetical protein
MDNFTSTTHPLDALVPPTTPGTAVTAPTTVSPPTGRHSRSFSDPNPIREFITRTLDIVDDMADMVAGGLGLRHP